MFIKKENDVTIARGSEKSGFKTGFIWVTNRGKRKCETPARNIEITREGTCFNGRAAIRTRRLPRVRNETTPKTANIRTIREIEKHAATPSPPDRCQSGQGNSQGWVPTTSSHNGNERRDKKGTSKTKGRGEAKGEKRRIETRKEGPPAGRWGEPIWDSGNNRHSPTWCW